MYVGDWIGAGTIPGSEKGPRFASGVKLGRQEPFTLNSGEERTFIEDHNTLTLVGPAVGDDY